MNTGGVASSTHTLYSIDQAIKCDRNAAIIAARKAAVGRGILESTRIQNAVNSAANCFNPANTNYTRPPPPAPCPPIPAEYLSSGIPQSRPRFECYSSVVGFI